MCNRVPRLSGWVLFSQSVKPFGGIVLSHGTAAWSGKTRQNMTVHRIFQGNGQAFLVRRKEEVQTFSVMGQETYLHHHRR